MGSFAYFRVEHASYNRSDWGYGRVAEAAHYAANQNKRGHVVTVGLPLFSTSYEAKQAFLQLEKQNTRKNARLGETLIVSFPKEVSEQHRLTMMERYLARITFDGQIYAQAYEHRDHPDNPHFHVILMDRDRITGKSVGKYGHSRSYRKKIGLEPNVTEWMRMQWEETGNEVFAEFGYSLVFDRRSNLERGLEPPAKHIGYHNDNSLQPIEEAMEGELDFVRPHEADISTAAYKVRELYGASLNLHHIRQAQKSIQEAESRLAFLRSQKEQTQKQKAAHFDDTSILKVQANSAEKQFAMYQKPSGKLRGLAFSFLRFTFKSKTRVLAEAAQLEAHEKAREYGRAERVKADYERRLQQLGKEIDNAEETLMMRRNDIIGVNGTMRDLEQAESVHANHINRLVRGTEKEPPIDPFEASRAWELGELTDEELRSYCIHSGNSDLLAQLEDALAEEERERYSLSP